MTPVEFQNLYLGTFKPDPMELLSNSELLRIEGDKFMPREHKRKARKIRHRRMDRKVLIT